MSDSKNSQPDLSGSKTIAELKASYDNTIAGIREKYDKKIEGLEEKLTEKINTIVELEKAIKEMELFSPASKITKGEKQELAEAREAYRSWEYTYDNGRVRIQFLVDPLSKEINSLSFEDLR